MDVGFAGVDVVVAGFDGGDVDREGAVEGGEATGAFLDGRDCAEDDELVVVKAGAGDVVLEKSFGWRHDAAVSAPNFVKEWRDDAIVHVTGEAEVEFAEFFFNWLI